MADQRTASILAKEGFDLWQANRSGYIHAAQTRGVVLYDGECGFCSWWVPFWQPTLNRAGFNIAALQSSQFSQDIDLDAPESWDLTVLLADGRKVLGADAYRHVMRRIWWAYPLYLLAITPGLRRVFNWAYTTFAQNRYCISRACGLDAKHH